MTNKQVYRGRFAPSPSGPLHFGSLLAATASYLQARKNNGQWYLRIEDIDPPREVSGASKHIIKTLQDYGFEWDKLSYQSERTEIYQDYLQQLQQAKLAYDCGCSRKQISEYNLKHQLNTNCYPGTCREGLNGKQARAIRFKIEKPLLTINDAIQGEKTLNLDEIAGDFILKRADGFYSYQLAVAIDDSLQEITEVVRGYDLFESSFYQQAIRNALGLTSPGYAHIPVAVSREGIKLSKQSAAKDISTEVANKLLWLALKQLGQQPPLTLQFDGLKQIWGWAIKNWQLANVPRVHSFASLVE